MNDDPLLWLLQTNDTSYPSGSYAHSFALEELVEAGAVAGADGLGDYLLRQVVPALLRFEVPFFVAAHAAAVTDDGRRLLELDAELDAWRLPAELRDASRRIGSQRLDLLVRLDPCPLVRSLHRASPRCHHLVVAAVELRNCTAAQAARAVGYQALAAQTSASMKLLRIGQTACQSLLSRALAAFAAGLPAALRRTPDGWFNPLVETASLRHARSRSRLFIS